MKAKIKSEADFIAAGYVKNNRSNLNYLTLEDYKNTVPGTGERHKVTNHVSAITRYQAVHFLGKSHEISSVYRDEKTGQWRVNFVRKDEAGSYYFSAPVEMTDVDHKKWYKKRVKSKLLGIELVEHDHGITFPNKPTTPLKKEELIKELKRIAAFLKIKKI